MEQPDSESSCWSMGQFLKIPIFNFSNVLSACFEWKFKSSVMSSPPAFKSKQLIPPGCLFKIEVMSYTCPCATTQQDPRFLCRLIWQGLKHSNFLCLFELLLWSLSLHDSQSWREHVSLQYLQASHIAGEGRTQSIPSSVTDTLEGGMGCDSFSSVSFSFGIQRNAEQLSASHIFLGDEIGENLSAKFNLKGMVDL